MRLSGVVSICTGHDARVVDNRQSVLYPAYPQHAKIAELRKDLQTIPNSWIFLVLYR